MKKKIEQLRKQGLTIREIMNKVGLKSTSAVAHYLREPKKGYCIRCGKKLTGFGTPDWIHYYCENTKCNRYKLLVLV